MTTNTTSGIREQGVSTVGQQAILSTAAGRKFTSVAQQLSLHTDMIAVSSDDSLLAMYDQAVKETAVQAAIAGRIEQELIKRMVERGATAVPDEVYDCRLEQRDTYDQVSFGPLKEIFNEADLAKSFVPAHEETVQVKDKWLTTTVKALARQYGEKALAVVEAARIPGAPRVKFERKDAP